MKKFFTYLDTKLDKRGLYSPSHTIYVPLLYGKAEIVDEASSPIKTPNSLLSLGYVNILDETIKSFVDELLTMGGGVNQIKAITNEEARQMLLDNGYEEISTNTFEIVAKGVDEITKDGVPAVTLIVE